MLFEIKHRITRSVLFSLECGSLKLCMEAAMYPAEKPEEGGE